jgi:biotin operon repressor
MASLKSALYGQCIDALKKSGKVESKFSHGSVFWRLVIEAPKAKPSKGKASKPAPKKAPAKGKGKGKGSKAAASEAAHLAAYEAECRALVEEPAPIDARIDAQCAAHGADPSSPWAAVLRALEDATKRRSVRALVTATGLGEDAVECAIEGLLRDGIVVRARRGGYELASKAESRPSKPSRPAPPACPPAPAKGHPQRVLRGWVYDRVAHTGALPLETLQKESPGYHQEYIEGVVDLLLACECLMLTAGLLRALELPSAPTVDQAVLDEVAGALRDAPLTSSQISMAFNVHHVIIFDVLQELRDAGRVALRGDAWHLTHGVSEAEEEAA